MPTCPACGEPNPEGARFCLACGSPLRRVALSEERKVVTVLVCDLVGFTARSDRADPEEIRATLRGFHGLLKREIERLGGTIDQFVGDAVVGVFGAPSSHEDDPFRGVLAALRIRDAVAEGWEGSGLALRIGVCTGEAIVAIGSSAGGAVTGEVVASAGRIQAMADAGAIAVDETTYARTRRLVLYEGPSSASNGHAVVWRPVATRGLRAGEGSAGSTAPLVGRGDELRLLRGAFDRAVVERSCQMVTVTGEPGLGKSRLVAEFGRSVDEVADLVRWRQGHCPPFGDASFWPLGEIVKSEAGILDSDPPGETERKLRGAVEAAVDDRAERDWLRARLTPLVGIGGAGEGADRPEVFAAWRRFLEALASQAPLVLVVEDLHWADDAMLDFVDHLVDRFAPLPCLLVCVARPELFDRRPGWGEGRRNSSVLSLRPLSEVETRMLTTRLLGRALPPRTQTDLLERAGGNPLYAEEFVRMLADAGALEPSGGGAGPGALGAPVPPTVHSLIAARLDLLPPERKALLHDAAVLGKASWAGALAAMGRRDVADVRRDLDELARTGFLRRHDVSSIAEDHEYSFRHLLVRDVAYGQIPRRRRGARHRAAARWLEAAVGERGADQAELLAHHYSQALELGGARGEDDRAELTAATARVLRLAGDRALRLDVPRAGDYYRRALDLLGDDDPDRPPLLLSLADTETMLGRFKDGERDYEAAMRAFRSSGDVLGLGDAMGRLARSLHRTGDAARPAQLLAEAIELLEREPPGPELARASTRMAGQLLVSGRYGECVAWADRALALATELRMDEEVVRARQFRGAGRSELGDADGLEDLWSAIHLGLDLGLGEETAVAYGNLGYQLWLRDGPDVARQVWSAAEDFSEVRGLATMMMWSRAGLVEVNFDLGEWEGVLGMGEALALWDADHGWTALGVLADAYRARVLLERGDVAGAAALCDAFLPRAREVELIEFLSSALAVASRAALEAGDADGAAALASEFREATAEEPTYRAHSLLDAVVVLCALGDPEGAARLLPDPASLHTSRHLHLLRSAEALLLEAEGRLGEAVERAAEAARRWRAYGSVVEHAHALLVEGRCRARVGDEASASDPLSVAAAAFARLGAQPRLEEIDGLLTAPGALE